jgi:hypothetical protein
VIGTLSDVTHHVTSWLGVPARAGGLVALQCPLCVFVSTLVHGRSQRSFVGGIEKLADTSQGPWTVRHRPNRLR